MGKPIRHKLNVDINLTTTISDEKHNTVGVTAFRLSELLDQDLDGSGFGHDWFCDLVINTAGSGSGTELVKDTDYLLSESLPSDHALVQAIYEATGLTKNVYSKVQIISAAFQDCDLYFSYTFIADDNDGEDLNNVTNRIIEVSSDYEVSELCGNITLFVTTGAEDKTIKLPTLKNRNVDIAIIKVDDGVGNIDITDNDDNIIFQLWAGNGDHVAFKCGPTRWINMTPKSWKYLPDPIASDTPLGTFTSWTGTNNFNLYGKTIDVSGKVPIGTKRIKIHGNHSSSTCNLSWRAHGDTKVSNTPQTSPLEIAQNIYFNNSAQAFFMDVPINPTDFITEFTTGNTSQDLYINMAFAYYQ